MNWLPLCLSFASSLLYLYHLSLVIGILLRLVRRKEYGLGAHSLGLDCPLSEVGTQVGAEEDLFQSSPSHKSGMPSGSGEQEHYTTYINLIFLQKRNGQPRFCEKVLTKQLTRIMVVNRHSLS